MAFTDKTDTPDIVRNWPYGFAEIGSDSDLYDFLNSFANEYRQIDVFIDELYEQRFLDTATTRELEKLGAEVGITRRAGEDDEELRFRTRVGKAVAASNGTAEDIETILEIAFGADNLENIDVEHVSGDPITRFSVPQPYIDDIPLTRAEFEDELRRAFPCGHEVEVVSSDTFVFGGTGSQGLSQGELI